MRIKSSFVDYYDGLQRFGMADDLTYIRETKKVAITLPDCIRHFYSNSVVDIGYNIELLIYFCGKWYPQYRFGGVWYTKFEDIPFPEVKCRYKYKYRWSNKSIVEKFFNPDIGYNISLQHLTDMFIAPILVLIPRTGFNGQQFLLINDRLNKYDFQKVKDPYTAYQEIYQWLSNQASPEKPIPNNLTEQEFAIIKGFDKYSFRKDKSK